MPVPGVPRRDDAIALVALLLIMLVSVGFRFKYDNWLSGFDMFPFFLPNYGYVGDRVRDFQVPAWNPYFFSGTPMAGDASGGWMYLPAMIAFALFNVTTGIKAMVLIQTLIAGIATYLFGRRIGLVPLAALFSATALAIGPLLYGATGISPVTGQIAPFIAVGLLGVEAAIQAPRLSARLGWSAPAGIATSQMFLAWPQGSIYGGITIAIWMLYRLFADPLTGFSLCAARARRLLTAGLAMGAFGAAFGAAGILPRLEFSEQSSIPGGDYSGVVGGDYATEAPPLIELLGRFLQESVFWRIVAHNSAILILGLLAILAGGNRYGIPAFTLAVLLFVDLAMANSLTRDLFALLPAFETTHGHRPTASIYMTFPPLAMLGGAGLQVFLAGRDPARGSFRRFLPLPIVLLGVIAVERSGFPVGWPQVMIAIAAALLVTLPLFRTAPWSRARRIAGVGLLALIIVYPTGNDIVSTIRNPAFLADQNDLLGKTPEIQDTVDAVLSRSDPGGAGAFLQARRASLQPFRYAPYFNNVPGPAYVHSTQRRMEPEIVAILANGRSARLGLEQTSGYNPLHLRYYAEYVAIMNGAPQDYHWLDLFAPAVNGSPLLDMLNVRYVLVATTSQETPGIAYYGNEVYRDERVIVYENPRAFGRAWIVHEVRPAMDGRELALLNTGQADGRRTAFVDGPEPDAAMPSGSGPGDEVSVTAYEPERIELRARSSAPGLLVVSEIYAKGWNASVDGERVEIVRTNHALRGVPLPVGEHEVVMTYEPMSLTVGLWSTGLASVAMLGIWGWALIGWRRTRSRIRAERS